MTSLDACSCGDYDVSRRSLLKTAGLVSMAGVVTSMFGDVLTSTVYGATNDNVLVVVSLRGGVDGLSLVVPLGEESVLKAARPRTYIPESTLLHPNATTGFGLHPKFTKLSSMWTGGKMAAVHGVGMPTPNRSHFEAMEKIEDADPGSSERVGWINRMVAGLAANPDVFDGMQIGSTITPTSLVGPAPTVATVNFDDLVGPFPKDEVMRARIKAGLLPQYKKRGGLIGGAGVDALALAERSAGVNREVQNSDVTYPKYSGLGTALKTSAGLIRAKVGVKAVAVDTGGWDHHVDLRWRMEDRVTDLAECLAAFFTDLGDDASRVTVVTVSEFGRRIEENGSAGVDHGYGNVMLALGAGVVGGYYAYAWPGLSAGKRVDGDLAVTIDYRSVLTEILRSRFDIDTSKVFRDYTYRQLGFMTPRG